jgi:hypothetical protein
MHPTVLLFESQRQAGSLPAEHGRLPLPNLILLVAFTYRPLVDNVRLRPEFQHRW